MKKIRATKKSKLFIIIVILFLVIELFAGIKVSDLSAFAVGDVVGVKEKITKNIHNEEVNPDMADGATGSYGAKEIGISTHELDDASSCWDNCKTHGDGRKDGGTTLLDEGCRNYLTDNNNYTTADVPYWINTESINDIKNTSHRDTLLNDIRTQTAMWNEVKMHDGTGQIVKIYEVGRDSTTKPDKVNDIKVIEVSQCDISDVYKGEDYSGALGLFWYKARKVEINYDTTYYGARYGHYIDTILHEFGHALGLGDIDDQAGVSSGTHKTLMGYSRGTTTVTLSQAITYSDIQGVAVMTGRHVCKDSHFMRYVTRGNEYLHICFYCDRIDSRTSIISGSQLLDANSKTCAHRYEPMVSSGSQFWFKCIKCYRVLEESEISVSNLFSGGKGTKTEPYLINNAKQFCNIGIAYTKSGSVRILSYSYKLMADIDLTGENWIPFVNKFTGEFDGNGHSITYHTRITQAVLDMPGVAGKFGLFSYIGPGAIIKNLELRDCSITAADPVSYSGQVMVGILSGYIEAVADISSVTISMPRIYIVQIKKALIGGIAGSASRTNMNNCVVNIGNITCFNETVGGFAGMGDIGGISGGSCKMNIYLLPEIYDKYKDRTGRLFSNVANSNSNVVTNVTYVSL